MDTQNYIKKINELSNKVNLGTGKKDEKLLQEAIEESEKLLPLLSSPKEISLLNYTLGNAFESLFSLFEYKKIVKSIPLSENLQKAKNYFRTAIKMANGVNPLLEKQIWVNYGNCLDILGRGVEALYAFDKALEIDPNFSMGIANKAITTMYFAKKSQMYVGVIHVDAYQAIKSVINDEELVKVGGREAKEYFENQLRQIERMVKDKSVLERKMPHQKYNASKMTVFEKFYVNFCVKNKLFLNYHIHDNTCESAINDPIFIKITTKIDDNTTFYRFARYINQIKEDFAIARLLLVQSQYKRKDISNISKRTTFVYPLDYSQTHIYNGLLKSSFKEAYGILDKVSVFLNLYLDLGIKGKIYFETIWLKDKKKDPTIREEIHSTENMSLYAIYDIFRDFQNSDDYKTIKEIRNALTHRQLTIYESGITVIKKERDLECIESDEMLEQTKELIKLAKSVIMHLIIAIGIEERKRNSGKDKIIPSVLVDTTQFI